MAWNLIPETHGILVRFLNGMMLSLTLWPFYMVTSIKKKNSGGCNYALCHEFNGLARDLQWAPYDENKQDRVVKLCHLLWIHEIHHAKGAPLHAWLHCLEIGGSIYQ